MVKNIIFDFGDVFINLDKTVIQRELAQLADPDTLSRLTVLSTAFETGRIKAAQFIDGLSAAIPGKSREQLTALWNSMLLDFPGYRLDFIEKLAHNRGHRLFLLSNTNEIHIRRVSEIMGAENYNRFRESFEGFYLSHELRMAKPGPEIFRHVLSEHQLESPETLFIDDSAENIAAAGRLGLQTWHLQVGREDITSLPSRL